MFIVYTNDVVAMYCLKYRNIQILVCGGVCDFQARSQKLRKATISFVMSVRPLPVRLEQLGSHWMDFHEI